MSQGGTNRLRKMLAVAAVWAILPLSVAPVVGLGRGEREEEYLFAATYMTLNNPFFVVLHESIAGEVEGRGDRIVVLNPDYDQVLQVAQIEDLLSMGIDALFLNPVDWKGIRPALEAADDAGVPVFVVDAPVYDEQFVVSTIVSDNYEAGRLAALDLLERRAGGTVVILDHPTNKPSIDRVEGFVSALETDPDFFVVSQLSAFGTVEGALPQMENALQAHNDIDVVFGSNDPTCLGALAAIVAANRTDDILLYGVDGSPEGRDMVREGLMAGTSAQSPVSMGRIAAETAYRYLAGEEVPARVFVPVSLVTAENVDQYPGEGWQ